MTTRADTHPAGITALSLFFFFGVAAGFVALISLLLPKSFLTPVWRLNPRDSAKMSALKRRPSLFPPRREKILLSTALRFPMRSHIQMRAQGSVYIWF